MARTATPDGGVPRLDEVLRCLADADRRYALYYLRERGTATVDELAGRLAAWEHDVPADAVPEEHRERTKAQLYHSHLPTLADARIVEYDERSGAVRYREPPALVDAFLQLAARLDPVDIGIEEE